MNNEKSIELKLVQKNILAEGVGELRFEKPSGLSFLPGQFLQFKLPTSEGDILRSYSLTSSPQKPYLEICVKFTGGHGSSFFEKMKLGEKVFVEGPKGKFILNEAGKNNYFVGTGVGIAPLVAMVESISKPEYKMDLLFGAREEKELFWRERLDNLKFDNKNFSYRITLSRPSAAWTGLKGRVTEHLAYDPFAHYYLCGNVEMVKDVRALLLNNKIEPKNIHFEVF